LIFALLQQRQHGTPLILGLLSITIASDSLQGDAWQLGVGCFTDAAYTEPCDDWVIGNNWNSLQHSRMLETLATTTDNKHWTAYFTNPLREVAQRPNSANPVQFNPSEYYQLFIENLGISENLYGSASLGQPYFVINGAPYPPQPAEDLPTLPGVVLASQPDNSFLCAGSTVGWRDCLMSRTTSQAIINLGVGAGLVKPGASGIQSVTIAKDQNDSNVTRAWNISIYCFADAAYTTPCVDWVMPNAWDSNQAFVATEQATSSLDHKFWTAYFTDPMHERNADGTFPLQFNPAYYYQLRIEDVGWPVGAYGSRAKQEPFWVLEGTPAEATTTP
jgi:hypothetical protein